MFTNSKRQEERTGKYGTPRLQYLQELVTQFQSSTSEESKEKIVANLANFAYDPYNFTFLRQLNVLELFLDCITEPNEKVVEFGIGGICNSCVDPENGAIISQCGGIPLIIQCLSSPVRNSVNYALGALYYLCNESNKEEILVPEVVDVIKRKTRIPSFWQNLFCKKMFPNGKIEAVSPTTFPGTWSPCSEGNSLQFAAAENGHVLFTGCFGGSLQLTPSPLYWLFRRLITIHVCLPLNT